MTALLAGVLCAIATMTVAVDGASAQAVVTDAKLSAFVEAASKVDAIIERWNPRIAAAATDAEKEELFEQANDEAVAAIEETPGITAAEYADINAAAAADPALKARIDRLFTTRGTR